MTSLDLAFEEEFENTPPPPPPPQQPQQKKKTPPIEYNPQISPQQEAKERFTNYYEYQEQTPQPQQLPQRPYQYSFWDRMVMSRREVMKLFILSIVIILGISLEKIGCYYITNYLSSNDLTTFQELMVRLSFPIVIFIILWIIKSL